MTSNFYLTFSRYLGFSAGEKVEIHFYDESFQKPIESLSLKKGNELLLVERCLSEALRHCRSVNLSVGQ